jgi:hypothetical protein
MVYRTVSGVMAWVVALAFLFQPFTAVWQRSGIARLDWVQPAGIHETCLAREEGDTGRSVLIGCWYDLPAGATGLTLGGTGPMDGAFRPQARDSFQLMQDGVQGESTQLWGRVYMPVALKR